MTSSSPPRSTAAVAAVARTPCGYVYSTAVTPSDGGRTRSRAAASPPSARRWLRTHDTPRRNDVAEELTKAAQADADDARSRTPPSSWQWLQRRCRRCDGLRCHVAQPEAAVCALAALQQRHAHLSATVRALECRNAHLAQVVREACVSTTAVDASLSLLLLRQLQHVYALRHLVERHVRAARRVYVASRRALHATAQRASLRLLSPPRLPLRRRLHDPLALHYERTQQQQQQHNIDNKTVTTTMTPSGHDTYRMTRYPVMDAALRELGIEGTQ